MVSKKSVIACNRFGMGARPGDLSRGVDPEDDLYRQITRPPKATPQLSLDTQSAVELVHQVRTNQGDATKIKELRREMRQAYLKDSAARTRFAITSDSSFFERIVQFWTNHFAVSIDKNFVLPLAASFEQEAIRPYVLGHFSALLLASSSHPAMLIYLDNAQSFGPNSRLGKRRNRGLNENLSREILELHTLGVNGGYTQDDVTEFAKVLTGWTVPIGRLRERLDLNGDTFVFVDRLHEPGSHRVLGKKYGQNGLNQGKAVMSDLANHPSTAKHLATKLARHFIADDPPAQVVDRLTDVYLKNGGHLTSVYQALIDCKECWQDHQNKYKTPNDLVTSALRGLGFVPKDRQLAGSLSALGQTVYQPGSPAGWPDVSSAWDGPAALGKRIDWANTVSSRITPKGSIQDLAKSLLGSSLTDHTVLSLKRAESKSQALSLLLLSPEFLRR